MTKYVDEYTPTTDEVRQAAGDIFCTDPDDPCHKHECPGDELFDRWLAQHDREVKATALRKAADACQRVIAAGSHSDLAQTIAALTSGLLRDLAQLAARGEDA